MVRYFLNGFLSAVSPGSRVKLSAQACGPLASSLISRGGESKDVEHGMFGFLLYCLTELPGRNCHSILQMRKLRFP